MQPHQSLPVLQRSVIVFSKNYLPMSRVSLKRAVVLLITKQAEPLGYGAETLWQVRSPSLVVEVPAHIRLTMSNLERWWKVPPANRREVFRRDGYRCQYCGGTRNLTIDHIMPRSRGGAYSWDNLATACERCNTKKGDRTPQEAGMTLLRKPKPPIHPAIAFAEKFWKEVSPPC